MNTPNNKRRRESQQRIENAFIQLLQDHELKAISVTDICQLAGVNRTTFYANYQDVYALADAIVNRLEDEVLMLYHEEWNRRETRHNFLKLFCHIRDNQLFYKTYFKLQPSDQLRMIGYDAKDAAQYFDLEKLDYHIEFFGAGLNAIIRKWLRGGCRETPEEMCAILKAEYSGRKLF